MLVIAGLGNPGPKYAATRHNIGFDTLDAFANRHSLAFTPSKFDADWARHRFNADEAVLAKPMTFMNRSGEPLQRLLAFYKIPPTDLIVLHDDMDLECGRLLLRAGGSGGGHNGLKSIIQHLGTHEFRRLRLGVGRPPPGEGVGHVLGHFAPAEQPLVGEMVARANDALDAILRDGWVKAMNQFNRRA